MSIQERLIDILSQDNLPWKDIAIQLAKDAPKLFCEAAEVVQGERAASVETRTATEQVIELLRTGTRESRSKIAAIKLYRQLTGVGLKEAKEAVESIITIHGFVHLY